MTVQDKAKEFVISRTFAVPIAKMWLVWSDAKHFAKWWGPKGFGVDVTTFEFRPGGLFHYSMKLPNGDVWWGRFIYREIDKPNRIVFVNSFSDEAGGVTRAPFNASWPLEALNTLTFTEADGKTTLTLRGGPITSNAEELALYESMFKSMEQGFGGTFDQLEAHLATV